MENLNILFELRKFNDIVFKEENHLYLRNDKKYKSVTTFKKEFETPFPTDIAAPRTAKKLGISVDDVLLDWHRKGVLGRTIGTLIHKFNEALWNNKIVKSELKGNFFNLSTLDLIDVVDKINTLEQYSTNFYNDYKHKYITIKDELIVYDDDFLLAGTFDKLYYDIENNTYNLLDYKTDKKFETKNSKKLIYPLENIDDCEFYKYSLQLSLYKKIIEKNTNIKINELKIVWLNKDNDNYKIINCEYLHNALEKILI